MAVVMEKTNTLKGTSDSPVLIDNIFQSGQSFAVAMKMADILSKSTIIPKDYQNSPGNCLIALEMAIRLKMSPLMVMQNLYVVNGRPAWSSQFIVSMINSSKKYKTELQYDLKGAGAAMECYAFTEDHNGHKVTGPVITMKMAKEEGWVDKNGSKWKTMPEVMIRYRAASFFGRLNCPDMIMGIYSVEETIELSEDEYKVLDAMEAVKEEAALQANQTPLEAEAPPWLQGIDDVTEVIQEKAPVSKPKAEEKKMEPDW
jgi:hypothetical protein